MGVRGVNLPLISARTCPKQRVIPDTARFFPQQQRLRRTPGDEALRNRFVISTEGEQGAPLELSSFPIDATRRGTAELDVIHWKFQASSGTASLSIYVVEAVLSSSSHLPLDMPSKAKSKIPPGWPGEVVYLQAPSYSEKVHSDEFTILISARSDLEDGAHVYKVSGPYSNVKITAISDSSHPANGQYGLFANQLLTPDSFILPYLGYVHDQTDTDETSNYDLSLDRELGIGVDATKMGNEARFINDYRGVAPAPNAEFRDIVVDIGNGKVEKRVGVFVLSAGKSKKRAGGIARGQEILVSYGKGFWTERQAVEE